MVTKISFKVIRLSTCCEGFVAGDLEVHNPNTKGWKSARFCSYPQEIVLLLSDVSWISKIQLLSHQHNVASKIEIFVGMPESWNNLSLAACQFKRLGYITLSSNEDSNFKARELKSIHVDTEGYFVKLLVHENHVNKLNIYNQVGIVAINIVGKLCSQVTDQQSIMTDLPVVNNNKSPRDSSKVLLESLAFDMYQDPETAQLIHKLEDKKSQAVLEERFDYAKKLKQALADLYKVGEKLSALELEKKEAIEMEDYDKAKLKKIQCDEYRLHVYQQLNVCDLLEIPVVAKKTPPKMSPESMKKIEKENLIESVENTLHLPSVHMVTLQCKETPVKSPTKTTPLPDVHASEIEEGEEGLKRHLPALKSTSSVSMVAEETLPDEYQERTKELALLTEKEEREASTIIDVFGMNAAQKLFSKCWKHRQELLRDLQGELKKDDNDGSQASKEISRAVVAVVQKVLHDQVFVVLSEGISLFKDLLADYIPQKNLGRSEVSLVLDKLLPVILKKTGDVVARSRSAMINTVVDVAKLPHVKSLGIIPTALTKDVKTKKSWRLFKSQIEITRTLIEDIGLNTPGGFTTERVMAVLRIGLDHPNNEVREASLNCLFEIYKKIGITLKAFLPSDDSITRKNPIYTRLFDGLDKIDGVPTEAERKAQALKKGKEKDSKMKALEDQLDKVRTLNSKMASKDGKKEEILKKQKDLPSKKKETEKSPLKKGSHEKATNKMCIFCDKETSNVDVHYWKDCPLLSRCPGCSQVVEILTMSDHLLNECKNKVNYVACGTCAMALSLKEENVHRKTCKNFVANEQYTCPICFQHVLKDDKKWKDHLMVKCKANKKRIQGNLAKDDATTRHFKSKLPTRTPKKAK